MLREISVLKIEDAVARLCITANRVLPCDIKQALQRAYADETEALAQSVLGDCIENLTVAGNCGLPICQDTGMAIVFLEIGQDVHLIDGDLAAAVQRGVARGYADGLLRKSVVADPLRRVNTGDNTPAIFYTEIVPGNAVRVTVAPKGFGSENMSVLKMLTPAAGRAGVVQTVLDAVRTAGGNPCPPMVVGVGIGGDFEQCALLAKKALLCDCPNPDAFYAELETELLQKINGFGIGPQGFGGKTTALAVHISAAPTHIAGLPVAINIGCHVTRHAAETVE